MELIWLGLQPHSARQAPDRADVLSTGGLSDAVASVAASFSAEDTWPVRGWR